MFIKVKIMGVLNEKRCKKGGAKIFFIITPLDILNAYLF